MSGITKKIDDIPKFRLCYYTKKLFFNEYICSTQLYTNLAANRLAKKLNFFYIEDTEVVLASTISPNVKLQKNPEE